MDERRIICQIIAKFDPKLVAKEQVFLVFLWVIFFRFILWFSKIFISKITGIIFNIVALSCSILVNPKLTFFDVNNNFELAIIHHKVHFCIFFVSKWTKLTLIVLVNTLLIFKHGTLTYFLHIYQNTSSCWWRIVYFNFESYIPPYF